MLPLTIATPIGLLESIVKLCEDATKDLLLLVESDEDDEDGEDGAEEKVPQMRPPKVFKMNVPKKEDGTKQVPFIVVSVQTGHDEQKFDDLTESGCGVRIVAGVFNEDDGAGKLDLLNVITRIRVKMLQNRVLDKQFILGQTIDWAIDPYTEWPYHYGELLTRYDIPPIDNDTVSEDIERPEKYNEFEEDFYGEKE